MSGCFLHNHCCYDKTCFHAHLRFPHAGNSVILCKRVKLVVRKKSFFVGLNKINHYWPSTRCLQRGLHRSRSVVHKRILRGSVPPPSTCCRYQQIFDLLATMALKMYTKGHKSDENLVLRRVQSADFADHFGRAVRVCAGCPPRLQRWPKSLDVSNR
ncbi:hypothetical protein Y032_0053g2311 [Ancylostoma ceylanicum]|uniref:Uncharacterized protein n=1 Tax=Ancylostoma ceylanicum TaxID=53326 RepID=A0A016U876_9BILA|nr:hypothetical protein Y032_0053g2311 [Ancylostoma ceylanicum]